MYLPTERLLEKAIYDRESMEGVGGRKNDYRSFQVFINYVPITYSESMQYYKLT
jgi:hypothetical protein